VLKIVFTVIPFGQETTIEAVFSVFTTLIAINIVLSLFNLLPIPPLDGSHVIFNLLSLRSDSISAAYFRYGSYALIVIVVIDRITSIDILPIGRIMVSIADGLFRLFSVY
jgi:Zn-dependent protease